MMIPDKERYRETPESSVGPPTEGQLEVLKAWLTAERRHTEEFKRWLEREDGADPRRARNDANELRGAMLSTGAWEYLAILARLEVGHDYLNLDESVWRFVTPYVPVEGEEGP